jgi:L,D-peptidoglycan transpeptidase YkuD (ErfK/YbiS/YcfS/YnhG family)
MKEKIISHSLTALLLITMFYHGLAAQRFISDSEVALQIICSNEKNLKNVHQLLIAFNETPDDPSIRLVFLEKRSERWQIISDPISGFIGRNGFANPGKKREGDGKSPSGLYQFGLLFTYLETVNTRMPYLQSTEEDKWIDDPKSNDYNRHVRGETDAESYERLLLQSNAYKYCLVIEYNTKPVIKDRGSAIFLHLHGRREGATAGCIAIHEKDMVKLLSLLDPSKNPSIIMGNKNVLLEGI